MAKLELSVLFETMGERKCLVQMTGTVNSELLRRSGSCQTELEACFCFAI